MADKSAEPRFFKNLPTAETQTASPEVRIPGDIDMGTHESASLVNPRMDQILPYKCQAATSAFPTPRFDATGPLLARFARLDMRHV